MKKAKKKVNAAMSFRPSDKALIYLGELGLINKKTKKIRSQGPVFSEFINEIIVMFAECEMLDKQLARPARKEELRKAWAKYKISKRRRKIDDLQGEILSIAGAEEDYIKMMNVEEKKRALKVVDQFLREGQVLVQEGVYRG